VDFVYSNDFSFTLFVSTVYMLSRCVSTFFIITCVCMCVPSLFSTFFSLLVLISLHQENVHETRIEEKKEKEKKKSWY